MAIMCQVILAFDDPKSLRIMSIRANMVKPREIPKIIRIYIVNLSIGKRAYFFSLSEIFKRAST